MKPRSAHLYALLLATTSLLVAFLGSLPGSALAQTILYQEDYENGWNGWYADNGVWQVGEAITGPVNSSNVAGTILDGNYPWGADSRLIGPAISLPSAPSNGALWLRFAYWFNLHTGDGVDVVTVDIYTAANGWESLAGPLWGWSPYWSEYMADLAPYAGETIQIRFEIADADGSINPQHYESHGIYIDHVVIMEGDFPDRTLQTFDLNVAHPWDGWNADHVDWEGWYAENGCWQVGTSIEPRSGQYCAATNLSGNYSVQANSRLISPPFDLPGSPVDGEIWLSFWSWSYMQGADGIDYGRVQIQVSGGAWEDLLGDYVYWAGCWSPCVADLSNYAGQTVRIAFLMVDVDGSINPQHYESTGWYIDDIAIKQGRRWLNNPEDCEGTITGWASKQGIWQMGSPTGSGPGVAHSGEHCWGTNLSGNYGYLSRSALESTWIELPATPPVQLCFYHWFSFSTADGSDYGQIIVEHMDGTTDIIDEIYGSSGDVWSYYCVPLSAYAGQTIRVRLRMVDVDGSINPLHYESSGWYIDDIEFNSLPTSEPPAPVYLNVIWSAEPPVIQYYADPVDLVNVCIYYSHDEDVIPDLSNRLAVLPVDIGTYTDYEHPRSRHYYHITGIDALGHESTILGPHVTSVEQPVEMPAPPLMILHGVRPNPFNPKAELRFTLSHPAHVVLEVFDLRGRLVSRLRDAPMVAGMHTVPFEDKQLASGAYVARLQVGSEVHTCKMVLMK